MIALLNKHWTYWCEPVADLARLIRDAARKQAPVECRQIVEFRNGNKVIAPKCANLALNSTFLLRLRSVAKLSCKLPMGPKRYKAGVLVTSVTAEYLLDSACQIVVTQDMKYSTEI